MTDLLPRLNVCSQGACAWAFLSEGFVTVPKPTEPPSWEGCRPIISAHDEFDCERRVRLRAELQVSELDIELADLGGDPLRDNWSGFRPLTVGREEAWSDWLAHLLITEDAAFLRGLFGIPELPVMAPLVRREQELLVNQADRSLGNYRSDIIVEWTKPMMSIHIEVKLGDPNLRKTWFEARHLQLTHGGSWHHFLLVLPNQKREAERMKEEMEPPEGKGPCVTVITWEHVERELRRALLRQSAPRSWRGIARVFAGALGQLKLGRRV
jgi:hypothetical protein